MWTSLPIELQEYILQIIWKVSFEKVLDDIHKIEYTIFDDSFSERRYGQIITQQYNQDSNNYFLHFDTIKSTHIHYLSIDSWRIHLNPSQLKKDSFSLHKDIKTHRMHIDSTTFLPGCYSSIPNMLE